MRTLKKRRGDAEAARALAILQKQEIRFFEGRSHEAFPWQIANFSFRNENALRATFTLSAFKRGTRNDMSDRQISPAKPEGSAEALKRSLHKKRTICKALSARSLFDRRRAYKAVSSKSMHDTLDRPRTLLPADIQFDFTRNLRELEQRAKRPYSLTSVVRSMCETPPRLGTLEMEVDQELRALNPNRNVIGKLVPVEVLAQPWRRDLTIGGYPQVVQTTVGDQVIPFLRARTVCGQLGATIITGLTNGNVKLPRAYVGATASWLPEIGPGTDTDPNLDSFTVIPKRIQGSTVISRQLVYQSSVDIERFIANDIANAIAVAVDNAALNGTGTAPQPMGILHYPVNTSGSYTYASRSANVTFGGAATWPSVLSFEKILEAGLVTNDGTFGYATDVTVRDKWQQAVKVATYPAFLWENTADPSDTFGRVNGRRAISSTQLPARQVIFGKWSECMICSWLGLDIHVDPFSLATTGELRVQVALLADIQFRYPLAFCASADSGAQ